MNAIKIIEDQDDYDIRQIALLNNECRKISRKPRLFYIKKDTIIFDSNNVNHSNHINNSDNEKINK